MNSVEAFYQASSAVCFLMLGLWWAALTNRYAGSLASPRKRRIALNIHLSFLLPGLMSLIATLSGPSKLMWRGAFVVFCVAGAASSIALLRLTPLGRTERAQYLTRIGSIALYVVMGVLALRPELAADVGLDTVTPLQVEGLLLSGLILLGACQAWSFMMAITDDAAVIDLRTHHNEPAATRSAASS